MQASALYVQHRERLRTLLHRDAYEAREVTLASGRKSHFYIDCRPVVLSAEGQFLSAWLFNAMVSERFPSARGVGGMAVGAVPLVSATVGLSYLSRPLEGFYVRKQSKDHGAQNQIEVAKALGPGSPVVMLEDTVTSGGSALRAVEIARQHELNPIGMLALVDRGEGGAEAIGAEMPFFPLFTAKDIEVA